VTRGLVGTLLASAILAASLVGLLAVVGAGAPRTVTGTLTVGPGPALLVRHLEMQGRPSPDELFTQLQAMATNPESYTFDCTTLHGPHADLGEGTPLVVRDAQGWVVGTAELEGGVGRWTGCRFTFVVEVPSRPSYLVVLANRDPIEVDRAALRRAGGHLELRIPD
jgi:hypothetical protein